MTSILHRLTRNLRLAVVPLRIVLALTFALLVVMQVLSLPGQFAHDARTATEHAHLAWVMLVVSELLVVCVQVVIVAIWRLLTRVRDDRIFSERSMSLVDAIVWAVATAWLLLFGLSCYLAFWFDDPSQPLILAMLLLFGAVFTLLMVVMRALLVQATQLRTDLDAVI